MMPTIMMPWPPAALHSHHKGHWRPKARASADYKATAYVLAKEAHVKCDPSAVLRIECLPPDRRRRDCQNMPIPIKAAIDGIAKAMGCDDNGFRVYFPAEFGPVVKGGAVIITVEAL